MMDAMKRDIPVEILLVEDNPGDVDLTREALEQSGMRYTLNVVGDGESAMLFLRRRGDFALALRPDLVLLDLTLPKKSGRDVLVEIKADAGLRHIPVIVLTVSHSGDDMLRSYIASACSYVTKPVGSDQFPRVIMAIEAALCGRPPEGARP